MGGQKKEGQSERHLKREVSCALGELERDDEGDGGDQNDRQSAVLGPPMERAADGVADRSQNMRLRIGKHAGIEPRRIGSVNLSKGGVRNRVVISKEDGGGPRSTR